MIKIIVFDDGGFTFDRYRVCINNAVFAMSADASSPQGVNIFVGSYVKSDKYCPNAYGQKLPGIPVCILDAVMQRALEVAGED